MTIEQITSPADVALVKSVFYKIFPEEFGRNDCHVYDDSITDNLGGCTRLEYYLVFDKGQLVGISGIYSVNSDEAWLGWYGVVPEHRNKGYGNIILDYTLEKMQSYGYKVALLYTEKDINAIACKLYQKKGFVEGKTYTLVDGNAVDGIKAIEDCQDKSKVCYATVFFKPLDGHSIDSWNGTPMF